MKSRRHPSETRPGASFLLLCPREWGIDLQKRKKLPIPGPGERGGGGGGMVTTKIEKTKIANLLRFIKYKQYALALC